MDAYLEQRGWIACKIVSGGVGITAGTLGTPFLGALMSTLTSVGCNYAATSTNVYEDGDS